MIRTLCYGHCCDFVSLVLVWYSYSNIASRYNKFLDMISACLGVLTPEKLPPTERAAIYHSLRAHLQIIEWRNIGVEGFHLTATNWGLREGKLAPFMTNIDSFAATARSRARAPVVRINARAYGTVLDAWHHVGTAVDKTALMVR